MTLETFYLICFIAGFTFSVLSFLSGSLHLHLHLPKGFHGGGAGHGGHGIGHAAHGPAHGANVSHGTSGPRGGRGAAKGGHFSFVNPMTLAAFLTWFGGIGYITQHKHWFLLSGLIVATLAGLTGASIVFWFVAKVLMAQDYTMDPADYEMVGVLGKICSGVRENGTGELLYEQMGKRKVCAVRSEIGEVLVKGTEVVVTRYEGGIAYVRRWDDLAKTYDAVDDQQINS